MLVIKITLLNANGGIRIEWMNDYKKHARWEGKINKICERNYIYSPSTLGLGKSSKYKKHSVILVYDINTYNMYFLLIKYTLSNVHIMCECACKNGSVHQDK